MKNQSWMMIICCLAPLLLFFVGPAVGLKENAFFILIPVMILVCFMMMGKGGGCCGSHRHGKETDESENKQKDSKQSCH